MAYALWDQGQGGIYIDTGPSGFFAACSGDLNTLRSRPIGKDLVDLLIKRAKGIGTKVGKAVAITYTSDLGSTAQNSLNNNVGATNEVRRNEAPGSNFRLPAKGDSSLVRYGNDLGQVYTNAIGVPTPAYIALGHELIHALHVISGDVVKEYSWKTDGAIIEEARTVGLGPYASKRITENALRKEWGLAQRTYYGSPGDCDNLPGVT